MALTPEDVVNKRFQPTKFREGYDQDEVDDFLDEVVIELRRLHQENDDLRQQDTSGGSAASSASATDESTTPVSDDVVPHATATNAVPVTPSYVAPEVGGEDDAQSTTSLLQLARRLHEEHVRDGMAKRDAFIAEGHSTAARIVAEAEAEQKKQVASLDEKRTDLEQRIEGLQVFEQEYRQKLRGYIEGQLHDLDASQGPSDDEALTGARQGSSSSAAGFGS